MNSLLKQRNTKSEQFPCRNTFNHTTLWHKEKISPMSLDKALSFLNLAFFWNLTDFSLHTGNEKGLYLLRSATSAPTLMCEEFLDRKRWAEEGAWLDHQISPLVGHGWLLFGPTVSLQWHCSIIFSIIAASLQHHSFVSLLFGHGWSSSTTRVSVGSRGCFDLRASESPLEETTTKIGSVRTGSGSLIVTTTMRFC